jgi:hypothetical protein
MTETDASVRKFKITANQYEMFKFVIPQSAKLRIRMLATAPINLLLLDSEDRAEFEKFMRERNKSNYTYTAAWGRRSDLDTTVPVDPGTWYLVVEGSTEPSSGRVEVLER